MRSAEARDTDIFVISEACEMRMEASSEACEVRRRRPALTALRRHSTARRRACASLWAACAAKTGFKEGLGRRYGTHFFFLFTWIPLGIRTKNRSKKIGRKASAYQGHRTSNTHGRKIGPTRLRLARALSRRQPISFALCASSTSRARVARSGLETGSES
jgi:hypothetical protein